MDIEIRCFIISGKPSLSAHSLILTSKNEVENGVDKCRSINILSEPFTLNQSMKYMYCRKSYEKTLRRKSKERFSCGTVNVDFIF